MSSTIAAVAFGAFAAGSAPAQASLSPQERSGAVVVYDIPAGAVAGALNAFAVKNGLHLLYEARVTRALRTTGLVGAFSMRDGLDHLLSGTGLTYRFGGPDAKAVSIILAQNDGVRSDANSAEALPPIDVGAEARTDAFDGVGGAIDPKAYRRPGATTATKTDTPIMETPISIQVVPQQVLQDQQAVRLDKALENVSGVYALPSGGSYGASADNFLVRGFKVDRIYRDGVLQPKAFGTVTSSNDLADVDHVEVLKGPASILYGRIEPGALVNLVTKQPLAQPFHAVEQHIGSFAFYRTTLDLGGPISAGDGLFYRFNMAYENAGSFVDFARNERIFVAPALRWEIDAATQITFNLHYLNTRDPFINGIPVFGSPLQIPNLSRSTNLYDAPRASIEEVRFGYALSHAFDESWTLRHRFSANFLNGDSNNENFPFGTASAAGVLPRGVVAEHFRDALYQTSADITGHMTSWEAKHTLLVGADYVNQAPRNSYVGLAQGTSINIFTRVPEGMLTPLSPPGHFFTRPQWYGLFLQDQIELPHGIHVLAGLRYDNASNPSSQVVDNGSAPKVTSNHSGAVNPRFGLLWRPIPEISLYGSYVQNFGLPNGVLGQAGPIPQALSPETAQQWEAGVKTEVFDQRVTASFAYFNLTKQNIATRNSFNPLVKDVTGEVRSRGVELDVSGEVLPGLRVIGALAFTDAVVLKDTVDATGMPIGNQGKRFFGVPRIGGSFWSTYEVQDGDWRGLKFGAGLVSRGSREGDLSNTFQMTGFTVVNAMASYEWDWKPLRIKFQLNVDNLFDRTYFVNSDGLGNLMFGSPRRFMGSARVTF